MYLAEITKSSNKPVPQKTSSHVACCGEGNEFSQKVISLETGKHVFFSLTDAPDSTYFLRRDNVCIIRLIGEGPVRIVSTKKIGYRYRVVG